MKGFIKQANILKIIIAASFLTVKEVICKHGEGGNLEWTHAVGLELEMSFQIHGFHYINRFFLKK